MKAIWVLRRIFPSAQPIFHNINGSVIGFFTHEPESLYNNNHNGECLDFMEILSQTIRRTQEECKTICHFCYDYSQNRLINIMMTSKHSLTAGTTQKVSAY